MSAIRETITLTRTQTAGHAVAEEITVPVQLGPVRLRREIGRGGMGVVHLGRHELLDRDVAVKFLLHVVAGETDPAFTQFLTGARAASAVRHAALNTIHHADVVEGVPYLVLEYIDGPSLRDVLRDRGRLSLAATLGVLRIVCDAVGELHDRDIVHHDIKPSNILLDRDGHVFVTDFGLAAVRRSSDASADPLVIAGSPAYMAPELFEGVASLRTDVYALGVMTYELLTGELPFGGDTDTIRQEHAATPMPRGPLERTGIDAAVIEVIERAMHKQPVFRYKSARHFLNALEEAVPDRAVWIRGESALPDLAVLRGDASDTGVAPARLPDEGSSSYYDRLAARAAAKRAAEPGSSGRIESKATTLRAASGTLIAGVPCVGCGYDLRGLSKGNACPECGRPMSDSVYPDRLLFADRVWLTRVAHGARRLMILAPIGCVAYMFAFVAPQIMALRSEPDPTWTLAVIQKEMGSALTRGSLLVIALMWIAFAWAWFDASLPEPGRDGPWSRRLARALILVWAGIAIGDIVVGVVVPTHRMHWETVQFFIETLVGVAAVAAMAQYGRVLGRRIPNESLVRYSRLVAVLSVLFAAVWLVGLVIAFVEPALSGYVNYMIVMLFPFVALAYFVGLYRALRRTLDAHRPWCDVSTAHAGN